MVRGGRTNYDISNGNLCNDVGSLEFLFLFDSICLSETWRENRINLSPRFFDKLIKRSLRWWTRRKRYFVGEIFKMESLEK